MTDNKTISDNITSEILDELFAKHKDYVSALIEQKKKYKIDIRLPNMPEYISENIAKFLIRNKLNDKTCVWSKGSNNKRSGDLYSDKEKIQEVKAFTSTGPISFGPTEKWNVLYFLDMTKWLDDKIILYQVNLSNDSTEWKNIKINSKETFEVQAKLGLRPRINWDGLSKQLKNKVEVYRGSFKDIFIEKLNDIPKIEVPKVTLEIKLKPETTPKPKPETKTPIVKPETKTPIVKPETKTPKINITKNQPEPKLTNDKNNSNKKNITK
jgi:hypothetical protein